MERGVPVSCRLLTYGLFLSLFVAAGQSLADHSMVLVASADSPMTTVSSLDIRKCYLGFVVRDSSGNQIHPITNGSDTHLWEVFLQDVMGMTSRSYRRRLLTLTLQSGRRRPEISENLDSLLDHLKSNSNAVSFVWEEDLAGRSDFKILRVLWRE